jgi:type IV pilus assembly protein PilY1
MKQFLSVMLLLILSKQVFSEDIDLYVDNTISSGQRPNVLIILDNSPSMVWYALNSNDRLGKDNEHVNNPVTRAHLAREIVIDLINDNPDVDFALQIFNSNNTSVHGGRIVSGFPTNKSALIGILDNDTDNTNNNYTTISGSYTPLCETLYETYRYLSGGQVFYGNQDTRIPTSIISSGNYTSPFANIQCNKEINIIYITDGDPTGDNNANTLVKTLTGTGDNDAENGNFLGVLGSWMATKNWAATNLDGSFKDIDDTPKDDLLASVKIHTVGFGSGVNEENLLKLAARDGEAERPKTGFHSMPEGGTYYPATTAAALKEALETVIAEVQGSSTLTSASVSANSFDRTQTLDSVYYGMFEPSTAARWQGNLKKYKIVNGEQVDALGNAAVDSAGEFDENSKSFWSAEVDGNDVTKGGVAETLRTTATSARNLLTDINGSGLLTTFSKDTIEAKYSTDSQLATKFAIDINDVGDISNHIKWAMGIDVDDYDDDTSTTDVRPDIFGDPLHSKPVVINYGTGNPRIIVGTNSGVLHMFEDVSATNTITESWAYLPNEFFNNIKPLRENTIAANNKIYGLDGEITLHINDVNKDGVVDSTTDSAWLFFGLRRGGSSYYALDVTYPDSPKLMWHITNTGDFSSLGLTFSKPKVVKSAFNTVTGEDNLVVIFGGGYDTKKDASGPNAQDDDNGAAIYMVSAKTGAHILKIPTNKKNGIASSIASLDSDSDGLVDRLYVGDTGGNVFRVDMPDTDKSNHSIITLANLGGSTNLDDIRFFNEPSIVRTYILESTDVGTESKPNIIKKEIPYDAILLGSGDRASPINPDTTDMFFMIKDQYIKTQQFGSSSGPTVPAPITLSMLYNYTNDPFNGYPSLSPTQERNLITASEKSGWYYELDQEGEKNSAKAIVINNVVYFTSYSPSADAICAVVPGNSWLYAVDLALGIKKYNWSVDSENRGDRIKQIGYQFLGQPTLISTPVIDSTTNETKIQGNLIVGKEVVQVGFTMQTIRTSLTIPET